MEIKGNFSWSWDWRGGEEAEISGRNSTLDVEEGEGDKGEKSENKRGETGGESEAWIGESGGKGEEIQNRIWKERETFPPIWERKYEGKKEENR